MTILLKLSPKAASSVLLMFRRLLLSLGGCATSMPIERSLGLSVTTPEPTNEPSPPWRLISLPSRNTSPATPTFMPCRVTPRSKTIRLAPVTIRSPPPVRRKAPRKVTVPVALITRSPSTVTSFQKVTFEGRSPFVFAVTVRPSSASTPPTMPYTATMPGERRISVSAVESPFPSSR